MSGMWAADAPANKAVDGLMGTDVDIRHECAVTGAVDDPWWAVDLEEPHEISEISYILATGRSGEWLHFL